MYREMPVDVFHDRDERRFGDAATRGSTLQSVLSKQVASLKYLVGLAPLKTFLNIYAGNLDVSI